MKYSCNEYCTLDIYLKTHGIIKKNLAALMFTKNEEHLDLRICFALSVILYRYNFSLHTFFYITNSSLCSVYWVYLANYKNEGQ